MQVAKCSLSRRTLLRGLGIGGGLPLLDALVPSFTALAKTAATPQKRFGAVYIPHGAIMERYTPAKAGTGFDFTPILKPLQPFKDNLVVVSNLDRPGIDDSHATHRPAWLSGAIAKKTEGQDFHLGQTVDQVLAPADRQRHAVPVARSGHRETSTATSAVAARATPVPT
jgi:hypothetical protein